MFVRNLSSLNIRRKAAVAIPYRSFSNSTKCFGTPVNVAVVGSGPGGFYTAQYLFKVRFKCCHDLLNFRCYKINKPLGLRHSFNGVLRCTDSIFSIFQM